MELSIIRMAKKERVERYSFRVATRGANIKKLGCGAKSFSQKFGWHRGVDE
jgi:hypothetical protein